MSTLGVDSRLCVYFDMNIWVEMARGIHGAEPRWEQVVHDLRIAVASGLVVIPLSATHYLELWHRRDEASREHVGVLMRDLSGYATLSAIHRVRRLEIEAAVDRMIGSSTHAVSRGELVGHGVSHAFDSEYGRFRFVQSLETELEPEGPAVPPPEAFEMLDLSGGRWEWLQLVGAQDIIEKEGIDRTPEHRHGSRYTVQELELRTGLERNPAMRRRLADIIIAQELGELTDELNRACLERRTEPHGLFLENPDFEGPPAAMRSFLERLPTVHVLVELRHWKHRDLSHPWEQHDRADLIALALAIPYCDAVVTERRWAHLAKAAGLAETYGTTVGFGLKAIEEILRTLGVRASDIRS